jgi:hypothetical protein
MFNKILPSVGGVFIIVFGAICVTSCADDNILKAAGTLSKDGQTVAAQYSQYMNNAAEAFQNQCDFENFTQLIALRKSQKPVDIYIKQAPNCLADSSRQQTITELRKWAKDGDAVSAAYGALLKLSDTSQNTDVQSAVNNAATEIASAAKQSFSDPVKNALDAAVSALVKYRETEGVQQFAQAMGKVPSTLEIPLQQDAKTLDGIFEIYDKDRQAALQSALDSKLADITPMLSPFFDELGIKPRGDVNGDVYLTTFAKTVNPVKLESAGQQARTSLISALQKLSDETSNLASGKDYPTSIGNDIDTVSQFLDLAGAVIHPTITASASQGKSK